MGHKRYMFLLIFFKHVETKNSKKLGPAAGAVLQYTTELITGFFPLVNISAVITAGIFQRVETDSVLK